jgi:hypothetical protein
MECREHGSCLAGDSMGVDYYILHDHAPNDGRGPGAYPWFHKGMPPAVTDRDNRRFLYQNEFRLPVHGHPLTLIGCAPGVIHQGFVGLVPPVAATRPDAGP